MYRQIQVLPEYHKHLRILRRKSPYNELRNYELHTVTYEVNCVLLLALRELNTSINNRIIVQSRLKIAETPSPYVTR